MIYFIFECLFLADKAYRDMKTYKESQSVVVSGRY